ncbi:MAG: PASTA domain-containing protein [Actinobacteria bacterium]|nr:PASTA domain-containing protein [Actinomycetota bacterium]
MWSVSRRHPHLILTVAIAALAAGCSYTAELRLPERQAASSEILWADGTQLTRLHAEEDREPVKLGHMSPVLAKAVVAIEDERFYHHDGVDARGVVRALTRNIEAGDVVEGGSTITQQYVRAVMLGPERNLERKLREAVMAIQLEERYSKRAILERYLNTVYFGNGAYGVQAAARTYFGRGADAVDLAQSALLAGLIRDPGAYDPYTVPGAALARRNEVLARLEHLRRAPADEIALALATPLGVVPTEEESRYPAAHFVEQVRQLVLTDPRFGVSPEQRHRNLYEGGLRIHTTLDPKWQLLAEQAVGRVVSEPATDPTASLVALDPRDGHVKAYFGGPDFFGPALYAKWDLAGQAARSPGSTFKPFVLTAALDAGIPLSRTYSAPAQISIPQPAGAPSWKVDNYDGNGSGRMDLTAATVSSVNTVYAQLVTDLGAQRVADTAARLGIRSPLTAVPSIAIGSNEVTALEMASAYGSFAADGLHADPVFVTRVTDRDGTVLYEAPTRRERVLDETTARTVTGVLQKVVERGTGVNARIGRPVAGKTGTAEEWKDAWFVGYTPELVAAVWVGFPEAERTMRPPATRVTVTGGAWPAQIWQLFAGAALGETPASLFPVPATPSKPPPASTTTTTAPHTPLLSVVGMNAFDATRTLADAGYTVRNRNAPSRRYPPGTVIAQDPPAGRTLRARGTVTITIANGRPRMVAVPTLLGMLADEAGNAVEPLGLVLAVRVEAEPPPGDPSRAGRVWKQAPIAGTALDEGGTVTIWVNPG